jgi:hypothetical protein
LADIIEAAQTRYRQELPPTVSYADVGAGQRSHCLVAWRVPHRFLVGARNEV